MARFAVKLLSKARFTSDKEKKAVRLEVDILKRLSGHEHMVTLHDHVEDKANVYLVMEWCKGGDLMKYVYKCKHFSEKVASCLFQQMLLAVQHCHENGVVHRDLKPDNFLFASTEGRTHLKIADFGLSTIIDSPDQIITDVRGACTAVAGWGCWQVPGSGLWCCLRICFSRHALAWPVHVCSLLGLRFLSRLRCSSALIPRRATCGAWVLTCSCSSGAPCPSAPR